MTELGYLQFSIVQQFLSLLPKIRSMPILFIWSGKCCCLLKFFTTYPHEKSNHNKSHAYLSNSQCLTCLLKKHSRIQQIKFYKKLAKNWDTLAQTVFRISIFIWNYLFLWKTQEYFLKSKRLISFKNNFVSHKYHLKKSARL